MNSDNCPQIIEHVNYQMNNTIYEVKWLDKKSEIITVGEKLDKKGFLNIYNLNKGELSSTAETITSSGIRSTTTFYSHTGSYTIACGNVT